MRGGLDFDVFVFDRDEIELAARHRTNAAYIVQQYAQHRHVVVVYLFELVLHFVHVCFVTFSPYYHKRYSLSMIEVAADISYTTLIMNPTQQTPEPTPLPSPTPVETATPPVVTSTPPTAPPAFTPAQPVNDYDPKAVSRVKLIAYVVIVLSAIGAVGGFISNDGFNLLVILNILAVIVCIGLLKFNKIAYHAFNVIAILSVLGGILGSFSILIVFAALPGIFALSPLWGLLTLLTIVTTIGTTAFMLWALIALHPKSVRRLFH